MSMSGVAHTDADGLADPPAGFPPADDGHDDLSDLLQASDARSGNSLSENNDASTVSGFNFETALTVPNILSSMAESSNRDWLTSLHMPLSTARASIEPFTPSDLFGIFGQGQPFFPSGSALISDAPLGLNQLFAYPTPTPLNLVRQPEELAAYFPTIEQRRMFHHFMNETAPDLLVIPTDTSTNPWLVHLTPLALGKPSGEDVCHDAFRNALLSLAAIDLGMKVNTALRHPENNAMYDISDERRSDAMRMLVMAKTLGMTQESAEAADLALASVIAVAVRDRLSGDQDWENPVSLGIEVIELDGGPAASIAKRPTPGRRFLIEQMACVEILGSMTVWDAPRILGWDNAWLFEGDMIGGQDHLEYIYGWDRATLQFCARSMMVGDEYKHIEFMKLENRRFRFAAVDAKIQARDALLIINSRKLIQDAQALRAKVQSEQMTRASRGAAAILMCLEISLSAAELGTDPSLHQHKVRALLETVEAAISQGMYAGFLLPLIWAAICSVSDNKRKAENLLIALQPRYHLEPGLMKRLVHLDWSFYSTSTIEQWEKSMRDTKTFVPLF